MLRKAIVAIFILLLTTGVVSAQLPTPSLHLNNDKPPRTKEQKENDKAIDSEYQSTLKKIPDAGKKDRGPMSAQLHQRRPRTSNNECLLLAASRRRGLSLEPL